MRYALLFLAALALVGSGCARRTEGIVGYWTMGDPKSSNRFPLWQFQGGGVLTALNPMENAEPERYRYRIEGKELDVRIRGKEVRALSGTIRWIGDDRFEITSPEHAKVTRLSRIMPTSAEFAAAIQADFDPGEGLSAACLESATKIARAALLYGEDHDMRLPIADNWMNLTLPYLGGGPDGFRCPAVRTGYGYEFSPELSAAAITKEDQQNERAFFHDSPNLRWNARGESFIAGQRHDGVTVLGTMNGTAVPDKTNAGRRPARG